MLLNWLCCFRSFALSSFEKCRVRQWHVQQGDKTPHWEQNDSAENKIKIGLGTQQIYITVRSRVVSKQSGNNKSEAMTGPLYHMVVITMASIWQHSDGHVSYCKSCKKMKERKIISLLSKLFFSVLKGDCAFTFTVNTKPATQIWTDFVQQISNLLKGLITCVKLFYPRRPQTQQSYKHTRLVWDFCFRFTFCLVQFRDWKTVIFLLFSQFLKITHGL